MGLVGILDHGKWNRDIGSWINIESLVSIDIGTFKYVIGYLNMGLDI